jgi:hypothetical protein
MISVTFNKEKITLLLNIEVERSAIDKVSGEALSRKLLPKDEFHITLIGNSMGEIIKENISQLSMGDQTKILLKIENLVNEFSWNFMLKDEYYYVSKTYPKTADFEEEKRESIIELIELDDANKFYVRLNELLDTNFVLPFPHITLFTNSSREDRVLYGIGIASEEDLRSLKPERV